jgi:urea carboxylase-associated protein 2
LEPKLLWEETLEGFSVWTHVLKRGTAVRLTALGDGANVAALFLNADLPAERMNLPDSLKAQHTAKLTAGHVLFSDMGRVLISVTEDTVGWHDSLGGMADAAMVEAKYGKLDYQAARNGWHQNPFDAVTNELEKLGLGLRDLGMNVNWFSRIAITEEGEMQFIAGNAKSGDSITLRSEMNTLAIFVNCQHAMDPHPAYGPAPVKIEYLRVDAPAADDLCRMSHPENARGFTLTERYFL